MEFSTALRLIERGIERNSHIQNWADLGAGNGLFTRALASLLQTGSSLQAIDRDIVVLNKIKGISKEIKFTKSQGDFTDVDFGRELFDGFLMANSLHFISDQNAFLKGIKKSLKPNGRIIVVEYDMDISNAWVPYPVSFISLQKKMIESGFISVVRLEEEPSLYHRANIYSSMATQ